MTAKKKIYLLKLSSETNTGLHVNLDTPREKFQKAYCDPNDQICTSIRLDHIEVLKIYIIILGREIMIVSRFSIVRCWQKELFAAYL